MNNLAKPEAAHLVLIDQLDQAALTLLPALDALQALEQLLDNQAQDFPLDARRVTPILRCIRMTARRGWPLGGGDA